MPWIIGGAIVGGALISGASAKSVAGDQMAFQGDMSNTAHQRQVADMRAAGLNPVLSATGGRGASSPPGALAQVPDYGSAASSALAKRKENAEIQLLRKQSTNVEADSLLKDRQEMFTRYAGAKELELADLYKTEKVLAQHQVPGAKIEANLDRPGGQGEWTRAIQRWLPFFNSAGSAARRSR